MEPMRTNSRKLLLNALSDQNDNNNQVDKNWKVPVKKNDSLTDFSQNFDILNLGTTTTDEFVQDSDSLTLKLEDSDELTIIRESSQSKVSGLDKRDSESLNLSSAETVVIDPTDVLPSTSSLNLGSLESVVLDPKDVLLSTSNSTTKEFDVDNDDTMIVDDNDNQSSGKSKTVLMKSETSFETRENMEMKRLKSLFYSSATGNNVGDLLNQDNLPKFDLDQFRKSVEDTHTQSSGFEDFESLKEICKQGLVHAKRDSIEERKWIKIVPDPKRNIKLKFSNPLVKVTTSEAATDVDTSFSASSTTSSNFTSTTAGKRTFMEEDEEEIPPSPESEPSRKRRRRKSSTTPKKSQEIGNCPLCFRNMRMKSLMKHIDGCNGGVLTRYDFLFHHGQVENYLQNF